MFLQASLFGGDTPAPDRDFSTAGRSALSGSSWVEYAPGWLQGSDTLLSELLEQLELHQRTGIAMYDSVVDEPRLTSWWHADDGEPEPLPILAELRWLLVERYHRPFDSIGFNLYRDGNDSVAWHADRHAKITTDPAIAILSIGAARPLRMKRNDGGPSLSWNLGGGDLFVMGGACQHEWQHAVPKLRRHVGPRMSITFRHDTRI